MREYGVKDKAREGWEDFKFRASHVRATRGVTGDPPFP